MKRRSFLAALAGLPLVPTTFFLDFRPSPN